MAESKTRAPLRSRPAIPERTKKFFSDDRFFMNFPKEYAAACLALKAKSGHDNKAFAHVLAGHMDAVINEQDEYIDYIANNAPNHHTRHEVVISNQSWPLAFSEKGQSYAKNNGFSWSHPFKLVQWLEKNYPFKFRSDPIPAWRKRATRLRGQSDPHKALKAYRSFMDETAEFREFINEFTGAIDQLVDEQIERARMERAFARERE